MAKITSHWNVACGQGQNTLQKKYIPIEILKLSNHYHEIGLVTLVLFLGLVTLVLFLGLVTLVLFWPVRLLEKQFVSSSVCGNSS